MEKSILNFCACMVVNLIIAIARSIDRHLVLKKTKNKVCQVVRVGGQKKDEQVKRGRTGRRTPSSPHQLRRRGVFRWIPEHQTKLPVPNMGYVGICNACCEVVPCYCVHSYHPPGTGIIIRTAASYNIMYYTIKFLLA